MKSLFSFPIFLVFIASLFWGASVFSQANWQAVPGVPADPVFAIAEDEAGNIWLGTRVGVFKYDGASTTHFRTRDGLANNRVYAIAEDPKGAMWFGTQSGASKLEDGQWKKIISYDGLAGDVVKSIFLDSRGYLWLGSRNGGLTVFDGSKWTVHNSQNGLGRNGVFSITEDSLGNIWAGNFAGKFSRFNGTDWTAYSQGGTYYDPTPIVFGIELAVLSWSALLASGSGVVIGILPAALITAPFGFIPSRKFVTSVDVDAKGNIWMGAYGKGAFKFDGVNWTAYTPANSGLAHKRLHSLTGDSHGNLWFATAKGLSKFDGANWTFYGKKDGLPHKWINTVFEDSRGRIWVGTKQGVTFSDPMNLSAGQINP